MTPKQEAALKLALEALEYIEHNYMSLPAPATKAITAIREALAEQPAPFVLNGIDCSCGRKWRITNNTLTASEPAQRTWVGLTDEEVKHQWEIWRASIPRYVGFATGIEAKLREKNNG